MGFAGTVNGGFFEAPEWVDKTKTPGTTSQANAYCPSGWWKGYFLLKHIFLSPNLVWLVMAIFMYFLFPYDLEAAKSWSTEWIKARLIINSVVTFGYYGFWEVVLYVLNFSKRKFLPGHVASPSRVFHNIWYCGLGVIQWTVWEAIFLHLYATGRLPFIADADAFATPSNALRTLAWTFIVPVWREFHFYFAHRFIHIRVLYKYVHSLHHRNVDIAPFSGLCMHPIEHMYYFSSVAPSLYFFMSPFHMLWNGLHLLISPAASHSGWEDHWQSDQFHYLHHSKFECNYGTSGLPLDRIFGTFRDKIGESGTYKGQWSSKLADPQVKTLGLAGIIPKWQDCVYFAFTGSLFAAFMLAVVNGYASRRDAVFGGLCVAVGPVVFGSILRIVDRDRLSALWPFHREAVVGSLGLHMLVSTAVTAVPVFHLASAALGGQSAYCAIWGC